MSIAGIDLSTHAVDIVLLDEDTDRATWHQFELEGQNAFDRARNVAGKLPGRASAFWDDVLAVGIEEPRGYGAGSLYRVQGAILACLPPSRLVTPWIPSQWRHAIGLPGNCPKKEAGAFALARWLGAPSSASLDATDAYCVALATRHRLAQVAA